MLFVHREIADWWTPERGFSPQSRVRHGVCRMREFCGFCGYLSVGNCFPRGLSKRGENAIELSVVANESLNKEREREKTRIARLHPQNLPRGTRKTRSREPLQGGLS
jgi:hypothetical protein